MHSLERTSTLRLLISIIIVVSASGNNSFLVTQLEIESQMIPPNEASVNASSRDRRQSKLELPAEVNTSLSVPVDMKAVLSCPPILLTTAVLTTWEIILRDKPSCTRAYRRDTNETKEKNCADGRITWVSRPDENLTLQIDPVAITHDGYYRCQVVTPEGNFHHGYHLQVLVPPGVTLFLRKNRTVVCRAVTGKPAAQISWTPEGDCVTEQENGGNGTVTVQSTCHWEDHHVPTVTCTVSHVTGNKSLSLELNQGLITVGFPASSLLIILYVKFTLFLVILLIVGFIYFQRINGCRARKSKNLEVNLDLMRHHKKEYEDPQNRESTLIAIIKDN